LKKQKQNRDVRGKWSLDTGSKISECPIHTPHFHIAEPVKQNAVGILNVVIRIISVIVHFGKHILFSCYVGLVGL